MIRVFGYVEKNVHAIPTPAVLVPNAISTKILENLNGNYKVNPTIPPPYGQGVEIAARYLYNAGPNPAYYNVGATCDNINSWDGILAVGAQLNCSDHGDEVYMYCPAGTANIGITILARYDLTNQN